MALYSLPTLDWLEYPDAGSTREPVPACSLDEVLGAAAAAGFGAVGIDDRTFAAYRRAGGSLGLLAEALQSHGLVCTDVGLLRIGESDALASAEELAGLARATDASICLTAPTQPMTSAQLIDELASCAEILGGAGARLALEFVPYGQLPTLAAAIEICDAVGWERCGVLVDTWHFFRGESQWDLLRSLDRDQIALVHANDAPSMRCADLAFESRFRRVPLGAGSFAIDEFFDVLGRLGYRGVVSLEVLSAELRASAPAIGARLLIDSLQRCTGAQRLGGVPSRGVQKLGSLT